MSVDAPLTPRQVVENLLLDSNERCGFLRFAQTRYGIAWDVAEDLLQDTAVQLLNQQRSVRKPRPYLYAVFRIRCRAYLSSRPVTPGMLPVSEDSLDTLAGGLEYEQDQRVALHQALAYISAACRRLLAARYMEGQSLREAAQRMTLAYSGITKTLTRCLKRLRACLT
jgi:RNA polymerase sigma factor (sigma-70 family)